MNVPGEFRIMVSEDPAKVDLELTCPDCLAVICDVESGDTLAVLLDTASEHIAADHSHAGAE
jgi:hypothetical protein